MTETANWITGLLLLFLVAALLVTVVACCATGRIPSNNFIGLRVGPIDATEEIWMEAHRRAMPLATVSAVTAIGSGIASLIALSNAELRSNLALIGFAFLLAFGTIAALRAFFTAKKLVRLESETLLQEDRS